jgi:hypothetical protein
MREVHLGLARVRYFTQRMLRCWPDTIVSKAAAAAAEAVAAAFKDPKIPPPQPNPLHLLQPHYTALSAMKVMLHHQTRPRLKVHSMMRCAHLAATWRLKPRHTPMTHMHLSNNASHITGSTRLDADGWGGGWGRCGCGGRGCGEQAQSVR